MRDAFTQHESCYQVIDWARFTTMRPKDERVHAAFLSKVVERHHVAVHVVHVVGVRRVFLQVPKLRSRRIDVKRNMFSFWLVVHRIKGGYLKRTTYEGAPYHCAIEVNNDKLASWSSSTIPSNLIRDINKTRKDSPGESDDSSVCAAVPCFRWKSLSSQYEAWPEI